ncbi:hypothetical protein ACPPVO_22170 [Dactylosporangium sp. McL0621]|uniref:hypothetical protein n=1 Tax=Dactylosporangium sp. McL0621 TaxID=3415678 RepID=UPI003CED073E
MATPRQPPLAWYVQLTEAYGQARLVATVVIDPPGGDLRAITAGERGIANGAPFYGLEVAAYVAGNPGLPATGIWGILVRYAPFDVRSAEQARAMATVFGRIERGLERLARTEGHPDDTDYAGHLIRVGRILAIGRFHVRVSRRRRQHTGEPHDLVDGDGLRRWVEQVGNDVAAGRRQDHLP